MALLVYTDIYYIQIRLTLTLYMLNSEKKDYKDFKGPKTNLKHLLTTLEHISELAA